MVAIAAPVVLNGNPEDSPVAPETNSSTALIVPAGNATTCNDADIFAHSPTEYDEVKPQSARGLLVVGPLATYELLISKTSRVAEVNMDGMLAVKEQEISIQSPITGVAYRGITRYPTDAL
jgi:hypothetical protein